MSVEPMPRRPQARGSDELRLLAEESARKADDAAHQTNLLALVAQRVEKKLDDLIKTVGGEGEDERGQRVGTGLVGRVMRLETSVSTRFSTYDGWIKAAGGFGLAVAFFVPIIWWLTQGKLEHLFK